MKIAFVTQIELDDAPLKPVASIPMIFPSLSKGITALCLAQFVLCQTLVIQAQTPADSPDAKPTVEEQKAEAEALKKLGAQTSGVGKIGSHAETDIPEGYTFFPAAGAKTLLKSWGNLISGTEEGLITSEKDRWSVLFDFEDVGYVKDADKDELDAGKMLKMMQDHEPELNAARKEAGLPASHTIGFAMPPTYNESTHNLEWAIKFSIEGEPGELLNYHTKLLGRKGVMTATLMCDPEQLQGVLPDYQKLLTHYRFKEGETYAEYRSGDKLASYGLVGLVAGGAALAASKMGLFAKLGTFFAKFAKVIIVGVIAVAAGIKKFFGGFGRRAPTE